MVVIDWRLPENRRESFQRYYTHALIHQNHPGCVYALLPALEEAFELDEDQRAWLVWLNGNTQNAVTSLLLLEAAPRPADWEAAVAFYNEHFKLLEWDTDRRHQKSKFAVATAQWYDTYGDAPARGWEAVGKRGWDDTWQHSFNQPYMGRLSAWSMIEYARILLPGIPDAGTWLLEDKAGSRSHRNGIAVVGGYDAVYWEEEAADMLGLVPELESLADDLLAEARERNCHPDVSRLTMESAFCTYKSWHKPDRRYPNVYSDMMYQRIKKAEARFSRTLDLLWDARRAHLPSHLRLEDNPNDPGLAPVKQNHYRTTGEIPVLFRDFPDMEPSTFDLNVELGVYGPRKDPKW